MKKEISYLWGSDHLLINLGRRIQTRIAVLFWAEFVLTTGMATVFLIQSLPLSMSVMHWLAAFGAVILYLFAAYRFLSRMFYTERLVLDKNAMIIIRRTPFSQKTRHYYWAYMGPLHYVGKPEKTDHPLKGQCYDYFGLETHEHLLQDLHHEGNLYFNYEGFPIRFARGVYSWHAEEMVRMMQLYAGTTLKLGPEWERMLQEEEWGGA